MHLVFLADMKCGVTGGGYLLYRLARQLALRGHRADVFGMSRRHRLLAGQALPPTLHFHDRPYIPRRFPGAGRLDHMLDAAYNRMVIRRFLRQHGVDVICGKLRTPAIAAVRLAQQAGIRSANFVFETPPWMQHDLGTRWDEIRHAPFRHSWARTREAYLACDLLIGISALSAHWCETWLGHTKTVAGPVYAGIDFTEITAATAMAEKHQLVYSGRLHPYKNVDTLIRALQAIPDAPTLVIIGDGSEKPRLQALAATLGVRCRFLGTVTDAVKWQVIAESRFMVFPSSHEGFGIPPMEALACGKPCLCSDKAVFREIYGDHVDYFREQDVEDLRAHMQRLLGNAALRQARGLAGQAFIRKQYSWDKAADTLEALLRSLLDAA